MAAVTPQILGEDVGYLHARPDRQNVRRIKSVLITLADTVDDTDTVAVTLADYGLSNIKGIEGITHNPVNSVLASEAPTTSVTAGVLTITVGGSTNDRARSFIIFGEEA